MAKRPLIHAKTLEKWLTKASHQLQREDYGNVLLTCRRILSYVGDKDPRRAEALTFMGTAHGMRNENEEAYEAYSQALAIVSNEFELWYNRGIMSLFTSRIGQAVKDYRKAAALCTEASFKRTIAEKLAFSERAAKEECVLRGPDFTLDQLIEQEALFQNGLRLSEQGAWSAAEEQLRGAIAMGDVLPQPWGNLGLCLLMQKRYDEAEQALYRALEIDPDYKLAKTNLAVLEKVRIEGVSPQFSISQPFSKKGGSITFLPNRAP